MTLSSMIDRQQNMKRYEAWSSTSRNKGSRGIAARLGGTSAHAGRSRLQDAVVMIDACKNMITFWNSSGAACFG